MTIGRVVTPKIGQMYADYKREAYAERKPKAFDTPFRYSDALGCARALAYGALGVPETDPMSGADHGIADMGTLLHKDVQLAVGLRYPSAKFEPASIIESLLSGHADIDLPEDDESDEIKTIPGYAFDRAIGLTRTGKYRGLHPDRAEGPSLKFWVQGGYNARANGRSQVRIILISRQAVAAQLADEIGLSPLERFWWEWVADESEWGPLVDNEIARLKVIHEDIKGGTLPDRWFPNDAGMETLQDPENTKSPFPCPYCRWRHQCRMDGPGVIPVQIRGAA